MIDNLDRTDIAPGIYYPKPETTGTFPSTALGWRYGTYQVIERKTPSEDKYVVMTSSGSNQRAYRRLNDGVWSGWDINLLNADFITSSNIKKTRVALENDRLLFWAYTDDTMLNGYRVDFNGPDKRIYYAKITNGATNNFGFTTLTQ